MEICFWRGEKKKKIREKKEFLIVARYRGSLEYKSALNS